MNKELSKLGSTRRGFTSRSLIKAIFDAPAPEEFTRSLPTQALYLAIRNNGLDSSSDLLLLASTEQTRLLLDFDCWNKDQFSEERFWDWLALGDDEEGLKLLQRLLQAVDLKLLGLLVARYLDVQTFDEATDTPPTPGYYTPDRGSTWIFISIEDEHQHFLLGRLLAMLFESNADLFYQLLATPSVATPSMLEEESFADRNKRLVSEGIPEPDTAAELHLPVSSHEIQELLRGVPAFVLSDNIRPIQPLVYDSLTPEPLSSLVNNPRYRDDLEGEITFLLNAALVHFSVDIGNQPAVAQLVERVKGAINLGFQSTQKLSGKSPEEIFQHLGVRAPYQHAHFLLRNLRARVGTIRKSGAAERLSTEDQGALSALSSNFPFAPRHMLEGLHAGDSTSAQSGRIDDSHEAISSLGALERISAWLDALNSQLKSLPT